MAIDHLAYEFDCLDGNWPAPNKCGMQPHLILDGIIFWYGWEQYHPRSLVPQNEVKYRPTVTCHKERKDFIFAVPLCLKNTLCFFFGESLSEDHTRTQVQLFWNHFCIIPFRVMWKEDTDQSVTYLPPCPVYSIWYGGILYITCSSSFSLMELLTVIAGLYSGTTF